MRRSRRQAKGNGVHPGIRIRAHRKVLCQPSRPGQARASAARGEFARISRRVALIASALGS
ncbi:hypothetical protein ACFPRL_01875 [Pseudoclavibacter helvolus]